MDRCFGAILHFNELQRKLRRIVKSADDKRNKTALKKIKALDWLDFSIRRSWCVIIVISACSDFIDIDCVFSINLLSRHSSEFTTSPLRGDSAANWLILLKIIIYLKKKVNRRRSHTFRMYAICWFQIAGENNQFYFAQQNPEAPRNVNFRYQVAAVRKAG